MNMKSSLLGLIGLASMGESLVADANDMNPYSRQQRGYYTPKTLTKKQKKARAAAKRARRARKINRR
jgi:hypothetical protein